MSTIQQWLADLQRIPEASADDPDAWRCFQHGCRSQVLNAAELPEALHALGAVSGWLTETGRVVELDQQRIELFHRPLAGEFFRVGEYWQLSAHPRGRWMLYHHSLAPCSPDEATHLGEKIEHLMAAPHRGWLEYWRLWEPGVDPDTQADLGPVCHIALLTAIRKDHP